MLWTTLFNRLAKQPLRITAHNHVEAIIDDKHYQLTLKFDTSGKPYLVPMQARPKKPYKRILYYRVCEDTPEILGSGSSTSRVVTCYTEADAFAALADGRNDCRRYVIRPDGKQESHWWDPYDQHWKRNNGEQLPC